MPKGEPGKFLLQFLKSPTSVGAIAPSSVHLARAMVDGLDACAPGAVLEFGPGTGAFTAAIRDSLPKHCSYLGIEVEERFVDVLKSRFPDLRFEHGSAADVREICAKHELGPVRAIVSGLPFASLPLPVQDGIVRGILDVLSPGASFRTFQYVHAYRLPKAVRFRKQMSELFGTVRRSRAVFRNLPPAYSLTWTRSEKAPQHAKSLGSAARDGEL